LHRGGSHVLSFHANCILSASQPIKLHQNQLHLTTCTMSSLPPQRSYQNTLVSLLSFLDGQKYHKNTVFPPEWLAAISAEDLLRWMNYKTFGTPFPGPDANPTGCRSSTILFWKKSISFFIPNKHHPWDSLME
jgi:hypothetical protein